MEEEIRGFTKEEAELYEQSLANLCIETGDNFFDDLREENKYELEQTSKCQVAYINYDISCILLFINYSSYIIRTVYGYIYNDYRLLFWTISGKKEPQRIGWGFFIF